MKESLIKVINKLKTPLMLSGLVIVVLYGIFKTILSLPIFSELDSTLTSNLLLQMINMLFILALISIILGFVGYILTYLQKKHTQSNVTLVDAGLDPLSQNYKEVSGDKIIRNKEDN